MSPSLRIARLKPFMFNNTKDFWTVISIQQHKKHSETTSSLHGQARSSYSEQRDGLYAADIAGSWRAQGQGPRRREEWAWPDFEPCFWKFSRGLCAAWKMKRLRSQHPHSSVAHKSGESLLWIRVWASVLPMAACGKPVPPPLSNCYLQPKSWLVYKEISYLGDSWEAKQKVNKHIYKTWSPKTGS